MKREILITEELKEILKKIENPISSILLSGNIDMEILSSPEKNINYMDISHSQKGHISYLNGDRIDKIKENNGDYWDIKMRYHSKPGSVIKKIIKCSNYDIEDFSLKYASIVNPPCFNMVVVNGKDISKYYHYENYQDQRGSLGGSCMKGSPSNFFDIYSENTNQISMLVMINENNKISGRAILWSGENFKLMDRVYVSNDIYFNYFIKWANDNNYYYKEHNNWYTPLNLKLKDRKEIKKLEISIDNSEFEKYPYLDTFKWLDVKNKKLYNYIPNDKSNVIVISDHMGNYFNSDHFKFCEISGKLCLKSNIVYLKYLDKYVCSDDVVKSSIFSTYIYNGHFQYDNEIDDYIFNKEYSSYNNEQLISKKKDLLIQEKKKLKDQKLKNYYTIGQESYVNDRIGMTRNSGTEISDIFEGV